MPSTGKATSHGPSESPELPGPPAPPRRRVGLYGGTFDPVHLAHLVLAESCREQLQLDEVRFMPAHAPPHKVGSLVTPSRQRREMLELAIAGHSQFRLELCELQRTGPSFTVDTLAELTAREPCVDWVLLMGADSLRDFPTWKQPERIASLAEIAVANRADQAMPDWSTALARYSSIDPRRCRTVTMPALGIAASDLRRRVAEGRSIRFLTPRPVELYIEQHRLYRPVDRPPTEP
jgi:nicotinate-nucleotide adenylyltransferase